MQVIFIFGPAAAGKYSIGRIVSERLGIPLFHNHLTVDLVSTLFEFGTKAFRQLRRKIWLDSFRTAAEANQSFVFTFHPEKSVETSLLSELQQVIEECGGAVQYIELLCSDSEVMRRLANPDRALHGKLQDAALYQQLREAGQLEYEGLPAPALKIDTETNTAAESAELIVQHLLPAKGTEQGDNKNKEPNECL